MKTWQTKKTVCRSNKTGRFVRKPKCRQFRRQRVRRSFMATLFK